MLDHQIHQKITPNKGGKKGNFWEKIRDKPPPKTQNRGYKQHKNPNLETPQQSFSTQNSIQIKNPLKNYQKKEAKNWSNIIIIPASPLSLIYNYK